MDIEIVQEIGMQFIEILLSESFAWEVEFKERIDRFNPEQTKAILNWLRGQITWNRSKIWIKSNKDVQILKLIDDVLHEAEFCKKNLKTRPRSHKPKL